MHQHHHQHQQPTSAQPLFRQRQHSQPHSYGRRASFYDYTRNLISRGLGRPTVDTTTAAARAIGRLDPMTSSSSSISPQSAGSPSPLIKVSEGKMARRRWFCCVTIGFIISLTINIGSIIFVVHRLRQTADRSRNTADQNIMMHFQAQENDYEALQYVRAWKRQNWYLYDVAADGTIKDGKKARPPIHTVLINCENIPDGTLKNWNVDAKNLQLSSVSYTSTTGEFNATETGLYQVYSNMAFKPIDSQNRSTSFTQKISDRDGSALFHDKQSRVCRMPRAAASRMSCHTSVIFGTVKLTAGQRLYITATPVKQINCAQGYSFFSLVKLD